MSAKAGSGWWLSVNTEKNPKRCSSEFKLYKDATLVEVSPKTGRTHQIRVHAAYLNHPIIGDDRYGLDDINKAFKNKGYKRMFLHAETLQFQHPSSGETVKVFCAITATLY